MYPFTQRRASLMVNLRPDSFEGALHGSIGYKKWFIDRMFVMVPALRYVQQFLMTCKEFPQRQKVGPGPWTRCIEKLSADPPPPRVSVKPPWRWP
jgi:arylsulfatase